MEESDIQALLEVAGYRLSVIRVNRSGDFRIWFGVTILDAQGMQHLKEIYSTTRHVAVNVAYKHFLGETK